MTNGSSFPGISGKEYNLFRYTEIFPEFLKLLVEWFAFGKFNDFWSVLKLS